MATANDNVRDLIAKVLTVEICIMKFTDFVKQYSREDLSNAYTMVHDAVLDKNMKLRYPDNIKDNAKNLEAAIIISLLFNVENVRNALIKSGVPENMLADIGSILKIMLSNNSIVILPTGMSAEVGNRYKSLILSESSALKFYFSKIQNTITK